MGFRDMGVPGTRFRVLNLRAYDLKVWGCLRFRVSRFAIFKALVCRPGVFQPELRSELHGPSEHWHQIRQVRELQRARCLAQASGLR